MLPPAPCTDAPRTTTPAPSTRSAPPASRSASACSPGPQGASIRVRESAQPVLNFCANNYLGPELAPARPRGRAARARRVRLRPVERPLHLRHAGRAQDARGARSARSSAPRTPSSTRRASTRTAASSRRCSARRTPSSATRSTTPRSSTASASARPSATATRTATWRSSRRRSKKTQGKRLRMIATDGVFSMDGDIAPLERICDLGGPLPRAGHGRRQPRDRLRRQDGARLDRALRASWGASTSSRRRSARRSAARRAASRRGAREIVELLRQRSRPYLFSNTRRAGHRRRAASPCSTCSRRRPSSATASWRTPAVPRGRDARPASRSSRASTPSSPSC